jgi:membrane associated rhomboid family serine protease
MEFRPSGFSILPVVIKNLIIINTLVFIAQYTFGPAGEAWFNNTFALHDVRSAFFRPHQLVTHLFMHGDWWHILLNMFVLWMFGSTLENIWGPKRFLVFYIVCGLGAALLHLGTLYFEYAELAAAFRNAPPEIQDQYRYSNFPLNTPTVGASGAVFGCLAAFGYLFPNSLVYIYFLFPMKAKWVVLLLIGAELFAGLKNSAGDNVAHWAHLGGALVGFLLVLYWNRSNRRKFY